jgi:hypothetical protein
MESTLPPITEAEILSQVVSPEDPDLSPEVANAILGLRFRDAALTKMRELVDKNNRGLLDTAEQAAMEKYLRVGQFLDLMQAKARLSLRH